MKEDKIEALLDACLLSDDEMLLWQVRPRALVPSTLAWPCSRCVGAGCVCPPRGHPARTLACAACMAASIAPSRPSPCPTARGAAARRGRLPRSETMSWFVAGATEQGGGKHAGRCHGHRLCNTVAALCCRGARAGLKGHGRRADAMPLLNTSGGLLRFEPAPTCSCRTILSSPPQRHLKPRRNGRRRPSRLGHDSALLRNPQPPRV